MNPDMINGLYELIGGLFILNNCRTLYKDKMVRGVSLLTVLFFTSWGYWNLYYYPSLNQWFSFAGGLLIVVGNTIWISMALHYRKKENVQAA